MRATDYIVNVDVDRTRSLEIFQMIETSWNKKIYLTTLFVDLNKQQ